MVKRKNQHGRHDIKQKGQAMTEYVICAGIMFFALFVPFDDGKSVVDMLIEAAKKNHEAKAYAIAHPAIGSLSFDDKIK